MSRQPSVTTDGGNVRPFWRFLYLLIAPQSGWRRLKNAHYKPERFATSVFYPLLALMAVSCFVGMLFDIELTLSTTLQKAISQFVAGFAGYYAILASARTIFPPVAREKIDTSYGRQLIMASLSMLALALALFQMIPGISVLFIIVPIYGAYLIVKGVRYLRVPPEEETPVKVLLLLFIYLIPFCIYSILEAMMPANV